MQWAARLHTSHLMQDRGAQVGDVVALFDVHTNHPSSGSRR